LFQWSAKVPGKNMISRIRFLILILTATVSLGCSSMRAGKMEWVTPSSTAPRAGNVYLLRGWIGVFSTGIDNLTKEINRQGVRANVFQDDQWRSLARTIGQKYKNQPSEPVILIGHSYGADDVVRIARELKSSNVTVDLLITLDPVTPPDVPGNVKKCVNLFQSNGIADAMPFLRGVALEKEKDATTELINANIRKDRTDLLEPGTDHFNIEKKDRIHGEVIRQVLATCPPRANWIAARGGSRGPYPSANAPLVQPPKPVTASERFNSAGGN